MRRDRRHGGDVVSALSRATPSAPSWSRSRAALAARGHDVHVVLPWHPKLHPPARGRRRHASTRSTTRRIRSLNVFGYAGRSKADVALRWTRLGVGAARRSPPASRAARRVVARGRRDRSCTATGWCPAARWRRSPRPARPLVVSLHGSDVFVAERTPSPARSRARTFARARWVTACSADLRDRAHRARRRRGAIVGHPLRRRRRRASRATPTRGPAAGRCSASPPTRRWSSPIGRFVQKKGFEYLIDAVPALVARHPAGAGRARRRRRPRGGARARALDRRRGRSRPLPRPPRAPVGAAGAGGGRRRRRAVGARRRRQRRRAAQRRDGGAGLGHAGRRDAGRRHRRRWSPTATNGLLVPERDAAGARRGHRRLLADRARARRWASRARGRVQAEHRLAAAWPCASRRPTRRPASAPCPGLGTAD